MENKTDLKHCLDRLTEGYDARYLDTDPLGIVHEYNDPVDREAAGFIASALAYGGAGQIRNSIRAALAPAKGHPACFARSLSSVRALEIFEGFKHRWTDGSDLAFLFCALGRIFEEYGSIGALVRFLDDPSEPTIAGVMTRFSAWMESRYAEPFRRPTPRKGISYLVPSPARGSTCKRPAMYFRWMVRGPDGVDFGLWRFIRPSRLIIPVDRHIARMAGLLGLSTRKTVDWRMALEITETLRTLDPDDPVRYDFALVRPGITRVCTEAHKGDCSDCLLNAVCREAE